MGFSEKSLKLRYNYSVLLYFLIPLRINKLKKNCLARTNISGYDLHIGLNRDKNEVLMQQLC